MHEEYEIGTPCWVASPDAGWIGAIVEAKRVLSPDEVELDLTVGDGNNGKKTVTKKIKGDASVTVPLRNPPALEATSDLVTLSYLNEPSVLHAIRQRYAHLSIYTFSGIVLIATNPFAKVDNLYTDGVVQMYSRMDRDQLEPHLFSIAAEAFRCMKRDNQDQTIVVSGESGAGKTMSAKYIMRYFATVEDPAKQNQNNGGRITDADAADLSSHDLNDDVNGLSRVEREILATNPIMEAFGNAKTTRNDNSSRFGKYLEIRFDQQYEISGAKIRTYLLERSRIVYHPETERNYHIFYQMMKGLEPAMLSKLGLDAGLSAFAYINNGDPDIAKVDDAKDFRETRRALEIVGVDDAQQWYVLEILASLLHLGNIELKATSSSVLVSPEDPHLLQASRLLGIPSASLAKWLVKRLIKVRNESSESNLDLKSAVVVRDSISKYLYSALFDWLVAAVNSKLFAGNEQDRFIGVLDIYGFEHFKHNSFEQFCINYANEKLQQEFNQHVFKLEQEEYATEEIDWQYIDFVDNQPCINLIESKTGVLGLLDDESRLPGGTDEGFTQRLYGQLAGVPTFRKPRLGENSFIVSHYAHDVEYETAGFIEKNRDTVPETIIDLLQSSQNGFLKEILDNQASIAETSSANPSGISVPGDVASKDKPRSVLPGGPLGSGARRGGALKRPTLGNIFKISLIELMKTISATNAHYIRCIKPNEEKQPWKFNGPMVLSQLRACGVLETIRISSKGFPGRHSYDEFAARYQVLLNSTERSSGATSRDLAIKILENNTYVPDIAKPEKEAADYNADDKALTTAVPTRQYALGKTKVFYRAGMLAHLEKCLTKRMKAAAVVLQAHFRMQMARRHLNETLAFVRRLQQASRASMARNRLAKAQAEIAITGVQAAIRRLLAMKQLSLTQNAVLAVQSAFRSKIAQARAEEFGREQAAIALQSLIRAKQARDIYHRQVSALKTVQSMVRRRGARRQLQQLREEQHSVKHYEETQYRMENKVVELQNALSQKREDHNTTLNELAAAKAALTSAHQKHTELITEHANYSDQFATKEQELTSKIQRYEQEAEELRAELQSQMNQISTLQDTLADQDTKMNELTMEISELRREKAMLMEQAQVAQTANIGAGSLMYQSRNANSSLGYGHDHTAYEDGYDANSMVARSAPAYAGGQAQAMSQSDVAYPAGDEEQQANAEIEVYLRNDSGIKQELINNLIKNLDYPSTKVDTLPTRDVLFPANMTNLLVSEMWRFGLISDSEQLLSNTFTSIQQVVEKNSGSEAILTIAPFWLTNMHQIYSFMTLAQSNIQNSPALREQMGNEELEQYSTLTDLAKTDAENTIFNIYYIHMRYLKKILEKMIVPAIIDDQNIPGFKTETTSSGLFSNLFSAKDTFKMDDLILLFNKVLAPLQRFDIEGFYTTQILKEMISFIGAKSFNDMIMRRNFLTWRRAVQINYNVTRLAEWLKFYKLDDAVAPLENITQASKLLQLKKNWDDDIDFMFDVFWALNPSQIHRLMGNYQPLDYETPVSSETLEKVSEKIRESRSTATDLTLKVRQINEVGPFELAAPRILESLEPYIPSRISAEKLRAFTECTTRASRLAEDTYSRIRQNEPIH